MRPATASETRRLAYPSRLLQSDAAAAHGARDSATPVHDHDPDSVGDPVVLFDDLGVLVPAVFDRRYSVRNGRVVDVGPLAGVVGGRAAILQQIVILHVGIELFLVVSK